jgi:septum site-determining protein MinD
MKIDNIFFPPTGEQGSTTSRKEALSSPRGKREKGRICSSHLEREHWKRCGFSHVERRKGGVSSIPQHREGAEIEEEYTLPTEKDKNGSRPSETNRRSYAQGDDGISPSPSSPARTIVITSGKGGVGKTTATANLGMSMARLGYRVALIDADIGLRNLDLLLGLENRILYTAIDILDGQCRLDQALIRDKRLKNLSLLSISKSRQRYNVTRKNMENLVESIGRLGYHFILIDCPAGIDVGFINAISSAKEALIITTPEITAIRDADRVAGLLEANNVYDVKLLVNRVRPDMIQQNNMMSVQDVQEMLAIPLLGAIPEDKNVIISTNRGEPLVLKKKLTLSAIAFENAARRLIGRQDYFIDLVSPQKGIVQRIQEIISRP